MFRLTCKLIPVACAIILSDGALLAQPAAAQTLATGTDLLQSLSTNRLSDADLSGLRGGFELAPGVTAYFSFSQVSSIGNVIVQTITVPETELSGPNTQANFNIAGGENTNVSLDGTTVPSGSLVVPIGGNLAVSTSSGNGLTLVASQFGSSGITNLINNMANNTEVSRNTIITIATQGMPSYLHGEQAAASMLNGMMNSQADFR